MAKVKIKTRKADIGFITENDIDSAFLSFIINKYFDDKIAPFIIPTGSKASLLSSAFVSAIEFRKAKYDHVFILFDADNKDIEVPTNFIKNQLIEYGIEKFVTIIAIEPSLDYWFLNSFDSNNIDILKNVPARDLEERLKKIVNVNELLSGVAFDKINIETMRHENKGFDKFLNRLEKISDKY